MAAVAGYGGSMKVGTYTAANIKDWDLPLASDIYDASVLGTNWKQYLPGLVGATAKADAFFDTTDTNGQLALMNACMNGTLMTVALYTSTSHYFSGSAYIKQFDVKTDVGGIITAAIDIQYTGTVSFT